MDDEDLSDVTQVDVVITNKIMYKSLIHVIFNYVSHLLPHLVAPICTKVITIRGKGDMALLTGDKTRSTIILNKTLWV